LERLINNNTDEKAVSPDIFRFGGVYDGDYPFRYRFFAVPAKMRVECSMGMERSGMTWPRNPEGALAPAAYTVLLDAVRPVYINTVFNDALTDGFSVLIYFSSLLNSVLSPVINSSSQDGVITFMLSKSKIISSAGVIS
jgi:hypothetical protein